MTCSSCIDKCQFTRQEAKVSEMAKNYGKTPYEIHVTIASANLAHFKSVCAGLNVKPLLIAMQLEQGGKLEDLMTSSKHMGDDAGALEELWRISRGMEAAGYQMVRQKIETAPWHPLAPTLVNKLDFQPGQYFESHVAVRHQPAQTGFLKGWAGDNGFHLSKNALKRTSDSPYQIGMATLRATIPFEDFQAKLDAALAPLHDYGFVIEKEIVEFAWFDTNQGHDDAWFKLFASQTRLP